MNTYLAPSWTLWTPTTTNTSELKAGLGLLKTRGKSYGFSVGAKQSYKAQAVSQTYTSYPGSLPLSPTPLDPTDPWGHTSIILLSEVTLGDI